MSEDNDFLLHLTIYGLIGYKMLKIFSWWMLGGPQERYLAYTSLVMSVFREKKMVVNEQLNAVVFRDTMEIPSGNAISCIPFIVLFPSNVVRSCITCSFSTLKRE